jgi:hypothetical protein
MWGCVAWLKFTDISRGTHRFHHQGGKVSQAGRARMAVGAVFFSNFPTIPLSLLKVIMCPWKWLLFLTVPFPAFEEKLNIPRKRAVFVSIFALAQTGLHFLNPFPFGVRSTLQPFGTLDGANSWELQFCAILPACLTEPVPEPAHLNFEGETEYCSETSVSAYR